MKDRQVSTRITAQIKILTRMQFLIQDKARIIFKINKMGIFVLYKLKRIMKKIIVAKNQKHSAFRVTDSIVTRDRTVGATHTAKGSKN